MAFNQSASEVETMLPFREATTEVGMLTSILLSIDFSALPADKASVRALTLTYETKTQDIESVFQENVVVVRSIFTQVTSRLDDGVMKDVILLPLNALVNVRDYEKVLYTGGPLSGTYVAVREMAEAVNAICLVRLPEKRQNVVALILGHLFATKLAASPLFKPYSALSTMKSSTAFMQSALRDSLGSLLGQLDSFYEYTLKYKHVLYEKKKELAGTNEYGFEDASKWDGEKVRFAADLVKRHLHKDVYDASVEATMVQFVAGYIVDAVVQDGTLESSEEQGNSSASNVSKGIDFERRCIELLNENGWNAASTPKTGDKGVDIIATKRGLRVAIQCKHWEANIGSTAVQEVYTGSKFYDADAAVIIGKTHLTTQAAEIARKLRVVVAARDDIPTLEVAIIKLLIP